jgi:hypothetical protein
MSIFRTETVVSSAVATNGTFTVAYPAGTDSGMFTGTRGHRMFAAGLQVYFENITGFTLSFGASNITVTYKGTTPIPAGSRVQLQLDGLGMDNANRYDPKMATKRTVIAPVAIVSLGAPDTADADGYVVSQNLTAAGVFSVNTTAAAAIAAAALVGVADVPRNVVAAWTNTAVITVTGTDEYGNVVRESSASGTTFAGKKAFKTITGISVSADVTGLTVGTGDVLGLPFRLPGTGHVMRELQDGAAATAGTTVAAVDSAATATTGDVRGTYDPNAACDGSKSFQLVVLSADPTDLGVSQFTG